MKVKETYMEELERDRLAHDEELDDSYQEWISGMADMESERFARPAPLAEEVG